MPPRSLVGLAAQTAATGTLLVALALTELWLSPYLYGAFYLAALTIAVTIEPLSPGVFRRMAVVEPPYMAP